MGGCCLSGTCQRRAGSRVSKRRNTLRSTLPGTVVQAPDVLREAEGRRAPPHRHQPIEVRDNLAYVAHALGVPGVAAHARRLDRAEGLEPSKGDEHLWRNGQAGMLIA